MRTNCCNFVLVIRSAVFLSTLPLSSLQRLMIYSPPLLVSAINCRSWILSIMITLPPLVGWSDQPSFVIVNGTQVAQCVLFQTPGKSVSLWKCLFLYWEIHVANAWWDELIRIGVLREFWYGENGCNWRIVFKYAIIKCKVLRIPFFHSKRYH